QGLAGPFLAISRPETRTGGEVERVDVVCPVFFDDLDHIAAEAGQDGRDCDDGHDADYYTQNRQEAPELLSPHVCQGHRNVLFVYEPQLHDASSVLGKRYYGIEPGGLYGRVYSKEHADSPRKEHRRYHVEYRDCHWYGGHGPDQPRNGGRYHKSKD